MAKYQTGEFTGESKPCAHCAGDVRRRVGQNGTNWTNRRYCSRACSDAAQIKPAPRDNLVGQTFGKWVVRSYAGRNARLRHAWNVDCHCGGSAIVEGSSLKSGSSKSCGCAQRAAVAAAGRALLTHGRSKQGGLYTIWVGMRARCYTASNTSYPRYGGRGIVVCDRWRASFEAFAEDMGERPSKRHSLDRIDNDGPYSPSNCQWREIEDQNRNKRSNVWVQFAGRRMCIADVAQHTGVREGTLRARLSRGWAIERAAVPF